MIGYPYFLKNRLAGSIAIVQCNFTSVIKFYHMMIRLMKFTSHEKYCIYINRDECHKTDRMESNGLNDASNV